MLRWYTLSVFAALLAVSPVMAADERTPSPGDNSLTLSAPVAFQAPALEPASVTAKPELQLRPLQLSRASFETVWNSTLLSASSQSMGLKSSGAGSMSNHVRWAVAGAAIGAIVGLIDTDPGGKALIGGVVGFGLSYVMKR